MTSNRRVGWGFGLLVAALSMPACVAAGPGGDEATSDGEAAFSFAPFRDEALARIRVREDHRSLNDPALKAYLRSHDPVVAEAAAIAIGRIGDVPAAADVAADLGAKSARVRAAAAFALGLLGGDAAKGALRDAWSGEAEARVRVQIALGLGRVGDADDVARLVSGLDAGAPADVNAAAAEGLGNLLGSAASAIPVAPEAIARLVALAAEGPDARATAAGYALASIRGAASQFPEAAIVDAFHATPAASSRAYLARILRRLATPSTLATMGDAVQHDPEIIVRAEVARQLGRVAPQPVTLDALGAALGDPEAQVVAASLEAIAPLGAAAVTLADRIASLEAHARSAWIRADALTALVAVSPETARPRVEAALAGSEIQAKLAAVSALGVLATDADLAALSSLLGDTNVRVVSTAIDTIATFAPARIDAATKEKVRALLATHDVAIVSSVAAAAPTLGWTDFAKDLAAAYDGFPGPLHLDGRVAILTALGALGDASQIAVVDRGLDDAERTVVQAGADAYLALTGTDVSARIPLASTVVAETPRPFEVARALRTTVLLVTDRGLVTMRMLPEAPLTATNFVSLVRRGFYDGLDFHRVVPDFVAQGGDPRGDGYGGSDALVREEIGRVPHRRGTVGVATSGKDTGSAQFFVNHGWNVSLDGRYTVFAEVTSGMDVVDRLEVGDVIRAAIAF